MDEEISRFTVMKEYANRRVVQKIIDAEKFYQSFIFDPDITDVTIQKVVEVLEERSVGSFTDISRTSEIMKSREELVKDVEGELVEVSGEDDEENRLALYETEGFGSILEDSLLEMHILGACNTVLMLSKAQCDLEMHKSIKYGVQLPKKMDDFAAIDPTMLDSDEYKIKKLEKDRDFLNDILMVTYRSLCTNMSIEPLNMKVEAIFKTEEDFYNLIEEEDRNRLKRRELNKQLRQQRNFQKTQVYENDVIIDTLKTNVEDAALNASIRTRHVENWQSARAEQQEALATKNAKEYYIDPRLANCERRVHDEILLLLEAQYEDKMKEIEWWMEKYDKDIDEIEKKIEETRENYEKTLAKRIKLEKTLEKHHWEIDEWKKFVEEREAERQYVIKMRTSAVIVQSWWRGMIVRQKWGPFRVKKGKGAKGKGAKGKGKGKKK